MEAVLEDSDAFEVAHPIHERKTFRVRADLHLRLEGVGMQRILIGEGEVGGLLKLSFEADVKVDDLILEDQGH